MKNRIKQIRKETGLTQVEFGKKIGVKGNTVTNYETGLRNPTDAVMLSICREFEINEKWLRTGIGTMHIEKSKDMEISDMFADVLKSDTKNFKYRLVSALAKLNDNDWNSLEKLIESISEK